MKILRVEKLTDQRWLNLFVADYDNNGHVGRWVFASRRDKPHADTSGDAVVMVPILRNPGEPPRLVLVHEYRVPAGGWTYGLPAGLIEAGEDLGDAVRREMLEETGFLVSAIKRVSQPLLSSSGMTDETAHLVFIDVVGEVGAKQQLEGSELIEVVLADEDEVRRLCDDTSLRVDVKLWGALLLYARVGLGE